MTRRALLKWVGLVPFVGPAVIKALGQSGPAPAPRVFAPYLPATFPKWSKAVDGFEDAAGWALEIERARLPSDLKFPREGQVWEAVRDCEVSFVPRVWKQPLKLETVCIKAGEKVEVVEVDGPKPVFVSFVRKAGAVMASANQVPKGDPLGNCALQLKTTRTLGDLVQKQNQQVFFLEAFRLCCGDRPKEEQFASG